MALHPGDLTDSGSLLDILREVRPEGIVNLAAQSHVHISFDEPTHTAEVTGLGVLRLLEAIRQMDTPCRMVQMSSSEMFGHVLEEPQTETTPLNPRSPYGCAKAYGHYICAVYRRAYNMHISCAINFNTEGKRRGLNFVTRKITNHVARQALGLTTEPLELGNLDAKRDWSHVEDTCRALWLMLQQDKPDDFVLATGKTRTVRKFVETAYKAALGVDMLRFAGMGVNERGIILKQDSCSWRAQSIERVERIPTPAVVVNPKFFRPAEVWTLTGDASKAKEKLGWQPRHSFANLVTSMVKHDLEALR
jgi:GDPmannose 4,6-dehydratase